MASAVADGHGPSAPGVGSGPFDEHAAKNVLGRLGIATMPRRACGDRGAAHAALAELEVTDAQPDQPARRTLA